VRVGDAVACDCWTGSVLVRRGLCAARFAVEAVVVLSDVQEVAGLQGRVLTVFALGGDERDGLGVTVSEELLPSFDGLVGRVRGGKLCVGGFCCLGEAL
jgi:hypothetical protein